MNKETYIDKSIRKLEYIEHNSQYLNDWETEFIDSMTFKHDFTWKQQKKK